MEPHKLVVMAAQEPVQVLLGREYFMLVEAVGLYISQLHLLKPGLVVVLLVAVMVVRITQI
jgi:hypothetical protein